MERRVYEETGINMQIDRLGYIHENFFPGDSWITSDHPEKYFPEFLRTELAKEFTGIKHFVTKDI